MSISLTKLLSKLPKEINCEQLFLGSRGLPPPSSRGLTAGSSIIIEPAVKSRDDGEDWLLDKNRVTNTKINSIRLDSRDVSEGDLFLAYQGATVDSRKFITQAINNGAIVIFYDSLNYNISVENPEADELINSNKIIAVGICNLKKYVGLLISEYYGNPSYNHEVYAVTGTNGKTTCNYLLAQLLHNLTQEKVGLIGTTGFGEISCILNNTSGLNKLINTTPGPEVLHELIYQLQKQKCKQTCIEASSHGLDQNRLDGVNISTAIFTNISQDHLDYHKTLDDYYLAKKKLFYFETVKNIVINIDDQYGERLLKELLSDNVRNQIMLYGFDLEKLKRYSNLTKIPMPYIYYQNNKIFYFDSNDTRKYDFKTKLIGKFNIYNLLAVISALLVNDYHIEYIIQLLPELRPAQGRMEVFHSVDKNVDLIVDFAHTPDALEKALIAINEESDKLNNDSITWCVFGCGGDRDKTKRPLMGNIASIYADKIIITDDNPRTENSESIIEDIKKGIEPEHQHKIFAIISNRRQAIKHALAHSSPGDKILIAGKGHEDYQIFGTEKVNYNEREYVAQLIK